MCTHPNQYAVQFHEDTRALRLRQQEASAWLLAEAGKTRRTLERLVAESTDLLVRAKALVAGLSRNAGPAKDQVQHAA